jgi:phosphatidylserine decarboxylase
VIRTAPEGFWFILGAWIIAFGLILAALRYDARVLWIACALWVVLAVWVVAFFRDPVRNGERGERLILAPADGKVVSVVETDEPAFFVGRSCRISIFMNVFDVHVNRYPARGTVAYRHYNPGKFGHAGAEKSSLDNEQSSVGLETSHGKVLIRQIAGLIARRIVTDHPVGTTVRQGDRLGMIRFGSRVDLFLPCDRTRVQVKPGDTTKAGMTVVAEWI